MRIVFPTTYQGRLRFGIIAVGIAVALISLILKLTAGPETAGDAAAKDSPAFLVYKGVSYDPTNNIRTDGLVREDVAYFARKTMPVYDPEKNPAVVFTVSKISEPSKGEIMFEGTYERSKDKVEVRFKKEANERISDSIKNLKQSTAMSTELPSNSKFNQFIKSLPAQTDSFIVEYISRDGSIGVSLGDRTPEALQAAKAYVAAAIGVPVAELDKAKIGYSLPSATDQFLTDDQDPGEPVEHD